MIDRIAEINMNFLTEVLKDKKLAKELYEKAKEHLVQKKCRYKNTEIPILMKPSFITGKQQKILHYNVEKICTALNKFIKLYLEDKKVQNIMNFDDRENELFAINPHYSFPLVIARLDAFMDDYVMKYLEFNCDSPGGASYSEVIEQAIHEVLGAYGLLDSWKIKYYNRNQSVLDSLLACYKEFRNEKKNFPSKPTIAIVDWADVSTLSEFFMLKEYFEDKGIKTIITSPQEMEVKSGRLMVGDEEIHLVYKRVITRELLEKIDEVQNFMNALKEGLVCSCNSFRTCIVGNKKVLALLTDNRFQYIYDKEELNVIKETIPWTKIVSDRKVNYMKFKVDLRTVIYDNKDKLVLKPANSYGGKDVFLGMETDQEKWENIVKDNIGSESWVVQEYVNIPQEIFPVLEDEATLELKNVNINPFAILGKYRGSMTRVSDNTIINVSQGGGLLPTLAVERR